MSIAFQLHYKCSIFSEIVCPSFDLSLYFTIESSYNSGGQTTRRDGHNRQKSDPGSEVKDPNLSADKGRFTGHQNGSVLWFVSVYYIDFTPTKNMLTHSS